MSTLNPAKVAELQAAGTILKVGNIGIATRNDADASFAGVRGQVADGPLAGTPVFVPAGYMTEPSRRATHWDEDDSLNVTILEFKEHQGRPTLVCSERRAAGLIAEREHHTVIARINKLARMQGSERLIGFAGTVVTGPLTGTSVFFPCDLVVDRDLAPEDFLGKIMHGAIVKPSRTTGFVVSERQAAKAAFDAIQPGYRLRMTVEGIHGDARIPCRVGSEVWMQQTLKRGLPLVGKLDVSDMLGRDLPDLVGNEFWVIVTGKENIWSAPDDAGNLLVKRENPQVEPGNIFCVTCQEEHGQWGVCESCQGCLCKHGHQLFEGGEATCFITCELCGSNEWRD
ncbi:MAG: hypothetical protein K2W82_17405 [Candidatus Obscuribacterales bacterium]|nr:hypothetical protein [Candidatus Obscuribacterales bacterium]